MFGLRSGARLASALAVLALAACGSAETAQQYPQQRTNGGYDPAPDPSEQPEGGLFGPDGIVLFGGKDRNAEDAGSSGIGVNALLWRASLDTLSFMPLASADPFGGVIITDWYSSPDRPSERMKATVYILDRRLRADGLKVALFRQQIGPERQWIDVPVSAETVGQLENAILTRARQLRVQSLGQ
ncbi:DUF3576 domain-containing protein [Zavarzinia compransoris]|uniref:DUF3576 domain-containing protein n=1 Tax=Zavarzinia compransoris TaxID=1264899 RepID=A0A317E1X7_9PROT|nr:DUF3576 domain-containing protein [Zavarzinia compransoris]PWR20602.1 DUF3576 domain-containing protein [Zavarzinia compransoris]TDP43751.1 uncharacterized protein DUF3576 [Zavarzinia compransoris]